MFHRSIATVLLTSLLAIPQAGCIGQMALSGKVLNFNLSVSQNKWVREIVFVALYFIPVYPFASMIDLLIVNSLEFHTGTNPISNKPRIALREGAKEVVGPDGSRAAAVQHPDGAVEIRATDAAGEEYRVRLVPVPGGVETYDGDGNLLGRVDTDGSVHSAPGSAPRVPRS